MVLMTLAVYCPNDDRQDVAGTDLVWRRIGDDQVIERLVGALFTLLLFGGDQLFGDQLGGWGVRLRPGLVGRIGHFNTAAGSDAAA